MSPRFRRALCLPLAILFFACYLVGLRLYQNRTVEVLPPVTTLTPKVQEIEHPMLAPNEKININTATVRELVCLDGIGKSLANRIIAKREELGGFQRKEQIMKVHGVGEKLFERIKDYIIIE